MTVPKEQEAEHAQLVQSSQPSMHSVCCPVSQAWRGQESWAEAADSAEPRFPEAEMRM